MLCMYIGGVIFSRLFLDLIALHIYSVYAVHECLCAICPDNSHQDRRVR